MVISCIRFIIWELGQAPGGRSGTPGGPLGATWTPLGHLAGALGDFSERLIAHDDGGGAESLDRYFGITTCFDECISQWFAVVEGWVLFCFC